MAGWATTSSSPIRAFFDAPPLRSPDDLVHPGLGIDTVTGGAGGDDLLILDYSVGDEPDTADVTLSGNGHHQRRRISDNALLDLVTATAFERLHFIGTSKDDTVRGFGGSDLQPMSEQPQRFFRVRLSAP